MSTLKANKDKARFISNPISQDALDTDWVDHEVITKYKLPEIVIDATRAGEFDTTTEVTTGEAIRLYDGITVELADVGTVSESSIEVIEPDGSLNSGTVTNVPALPWAGFTPFSSSGTPNAVFDGDSNSACIGSTIALTIGILHPTLHYVNNKYTIQSYFSGFTARSPKNWTFQGSNNSSTGTDGTWDTLHTVTNSTSWSAGEVRTFTFTNSTSYNAYRIVVTANNGDSLTSIAELKFISAESTSTPLYIVPTPNHTIGIPTKAFFNKTIDTTLSAEVTGKCKSSTITQIGVL